MKVEEKNRVEEAKLRPEAGRNTAWGWGGMCVLTHRSLLLRDPIHTCAAHTDSVWSVAWSRDEQRDVVVTGSVDTVVKAWQPDGGDGRLTARHKLDGHRLGVVSVDVNRAGTGEEVYSIIFALDVRWHLRELHCQLQPSPIITTTAAATIPPSQQPSSSSPVSAVHVKPTDMPPCPLSFSAAVAVSSSLDSQIKIWDLEQGNLIRVSIVPYVFHLSMWISVQTSHSLAHSYSRNMHTVHTGH